MKKILILLLLFFVTGLFSQTVNGEVYDSSMLKPLQYVNISILNSHIGTSTDIYGRFELHGNFTSRDTVQLSMIGYETQLHSVETCINEYNSMKIFLNPLIEMIDEVEIQKKSYRKTKRTLGVRKLARFKKSSSFGLVAAFKFEKPGAKEGQIREVSFYVRKNDIGDLYKLYPCAYRILFYEIESNGLPGELLSYDDIIVVPENKNYKISVSVEDYNIEFPKDGVFVALEVHNINQIENKNTLYVVKPYLVFTHDKKPMTYSNFRDQKWSFNNRPSVFKKGFYSNLLIEIRVSDIKD